MTKTELESLRSKYADHQGDASFSVVSRDINEMLDALPESPRNTLLRSKYLDQKADHSMPGWIAQGDVELLAKEIVTIEPEPPETPSADEKKEPPTLPVTITLDGAVSSRIVSVNAERVSEVPTFPDATPKDTAITESQEKS